MLSLTPSLCNLLRCAYLQLLPHNTFIELFFFIKDWVNDFMCWKDYLWDIWLQMSASPIKLANLKNLVLGVQV